MVDSESTSLLTTQLYRVAIRDLKLTGLSSAESKKKQNEIGLNNIHPPVRAPAWLCCLLPCLLKTKSMEAYHECVPEHANVKRNGKWVNLDSTSIVTGDIIKVSAGERVPADMRIVEVEVVSECSYVIRRQPTTRQDSKLIKFVVLQTNLFFSFLFNCLYCR